MRTVSALVVLLWLGTAPACSVSPPPGKRITIGWFTDPDPVERLMRLHGIASADIGMSQGFYLEVESEDATYVDELLLLDSEERGWHYKSLWTRSLEFLVLQDVAHQPRARALLAARRIPHAIRGTHVVLTREHWKTAHRLLRRARIVSD